MDLYTDPTYGKSDHKSTLIQIQNTFLQSAITFWHKRSGLSKIHKLSSYDVESILTTFTVSSAKSASQAPYRPDSYFTTCLSLLSIKPDKILVKTGLLTSSPQVIFSLGNLNNSFSINSTWHLISTPLSLHKIISLR